VLGSALKNSLGRWSVIRETQLLAQLCVALWRCSRVGELFHIALNYIFLHWIITSYLNPYYILQLDIQSV
jgi:hypothetical protein